ncbi:MAG: phosphotransferase [Acidimicrobiales bacterium]
MSLPPVIDTAAEVTPEWLSAALNSAGLAVAVESVTTTPVGTGQMADSARLSISYSTEVKSAPNTLVGKFPSTDPQSRSAGEHGGYASEIGFYTHLAHTVSGNTPRCYYAETGSPAEFTLLMQDMAPSVQGDQIAGCSVAQAEAALVNLARFHGPRWCDETLFEVPSLASRDESNATGSLLAEFMAAFTPEFVNRYSGRLSADDIDLAIQFAARVSAWDQFDTGEFGLLHGDYRLDNLLFGTTAEHPAVTTVDWQTLKIGPPLRDTAYFLGTSLDAEIRAEHEQRLVRVYYDELARQGVSDYSFEQCWASYRLGSLQGPLIAILGSIGVKQTERGDEMFMAMIRRSGEQVRHLDALSLF